MCVDPSILNIASLGMQAVGAVAGYRADRKTYSQTSAALREGEASMLQQQQLRKEQTSAQTAEAMSDRAREAQIMMARLRTVGGESGLGGVSGARVMNEAKFNLGQDLATMDANRGRAIAQLDAESRGITASTKSKMASMKKPSILNAGLGIAGAGLDYYTRDLQIKQARKVIQ